MPSYKENKRFFLVLNNSIAFVARGENITKWFLALQTNDVSICTNNLRHTYKHGEYIQTFNWSERSATAWNRTTNRNFHSNWVHCIYVKYLYVIFECRRCLSVDVCFNIHLQRVYILFVDNKFM